MPCVVSYIVTTPLSRFYLPPSLLLSDQHIRYLSDIRLFDAQLCIRLVVVLFTSLHSLQCSVLSECGSLARNGCVGVDVPVIRFW